MTLVLTVLRCPDSVAPETKRVQGGEFTIGRGHDADWVMPDAERHLSKRHCVLAFRAGGWHVADTSSNGTFVNAAAEPLGSGATYALRDGDRLRLGQYEIEVRIDQPDAFGGDARGDGQPYREDPFAIDPFAGRMGAPVPPPRPASFDAGINASGIGLPDDFDPLAPDHDDPALSRPTQADHSASVSDAFRAAPVVAAGIPDDWDLDLPTPAAPPGVPPGEPAPLAPPLVVPHAAAPAPLPAAPPEEPGLMAAFLRGAGMPDMTPADPAATMEQLGAAFRAMVAGLRRALIARAAVKGEFRIEQTVISARGNNPLKFSADDDDALAALLGAGRRTEMAAPMAVADALRDIRLHELASVAAMQSAVRALVEQLDPAKVRADAGELGGISLPGQRKARAWDAYEALHARVSGSLADDFDSVFGKSFARAYEQALAEIGAKEIR